MPEDEAQVSARSDAEAELGAGRFCHHEGATGVDSGVASPAPHELLKPVSVPG